MTGSFVTSFLRLKTSPSYMVKQIDYEQSLLLGKVRRANPKKKNGENKTWC